MTARIVVAGSCMMDLVARIPRHPEPGETLLGREFGMFIGGKGLNQAVAAKRLGADVALIGQVGDDLFGNEIRAFLEAEGIDTTHVGTDATAGTGIAMPLVYDDGGNAIISIPRANLAVTLDAIVLATEAIRAADVCLVQFEMNLDAVVRVVQIATAANVPVIVNTAPILPFPDELRGLATVIVANETEAAALAPGRPEGVDAQARAFLEGGTRAAIVTLGPEGAVAALRDGPALHRIPPFVVTAIDSVGAGDAFCGALAVCLAEGMSLLDAARFASAAGALATTVKGAAPSLPSRDAVLALLGR